VFAGTAHVEVVVTLRPGADAHAVADWLTRRGLQVTAFGAGLLATGEPTAAFGDALAVPDAWREHIESVALVPPKHLYQGPR
jgi:hypothetical protein